MTRAQEEEIAAAAGRRLEMLRRELGFDEAPGSGAEETVALPERPGTVEVPPPGRHARTGPRRAERIGGWIDDRLPEGLRGRIRLGGPQLALVALLAAVALAAGALAVLRSGVNTDPIPVAAAAAAPEQSASSEPLVVPSGSSSSGASSASTAPSPRGGASLVLVDVAGRVRHPGVVQLPAGSRVIDALRKAGGARSHVDLTTLNLARVLSDGEQILVGRPTAATGGLAGASAAAAPPVGTSRMVNLNSATEGELESLPGVGPVTAQKILDWRQTHGRFSAVDELLEVSGIGDKTLARLAPHLTL